MADFQYDSGMNDLFYTVAGDTPYAAVLTGTQDYISKAQKDILNKEALTPEDVLTLKKYIENYLMSNDVKCKDVGSMAELVDKLYKDMALYSFLTDYLDERKIDELGLEEININSWDCVFLKTKKEGKKRLNERFLSPQHAIDVVKRMLRHQNMTIDDSMPVALGTIGKNIRIAVMKTPVLDKEIGVSGSIRIVSFSCLKREDLLKYGTLTKEMFDFLELCITHKISICFVGETGSGKTGSAGSLLSEITKDATYRVITLEEGSREFSLVRRDEDGYPINDVIHLITVPNAKDEYNIDQDFLLENLMRYDPDIIGVGEMRSKESFTAAETSLTNHTVVTTTHAGSAADAYERMVMLAKKAHEFTDATLYRLMAKAFPIIVFQEVLADGSRKVTEIIESEGVEGTEVKTRMLYHYHVQDTYTDELGNVDVNGHFQKGEIITDRLREWFIRKGVPRMVAEKL